MSPSTVTRDLPGEAFDIALFHYAIDGLILDRLTVPIDPETSTDAVVDAFVDGLLRDRMSTSTEARVDRSRRMA